MLTPAKRCTHDNPVYNIDLDCNRFEEGDKVDEHDDPREPNQDVHWGVGYHFSLLTEVVEEDESSEEESSLEVASSGDSDTEISSTDEDVFACTDIIYR